MIKLPYSIHRINPSSMNSEVELAGTKVSAIVNCAEVELVALPGAHAHGTLTLRFVGADALAVLREFKNGDVVSLALAKEPGAAADAVAASAEA